MANRNELDILDRWTEEIVNTCSVNESVCIAVFNLNKELVYANNAMWGLFKGDPSKSLINPSLDSLLVLDGDNCLIFNGYLTIGDNFSVNSSILVHIYRKNDELLIVGGMPFQQLVENNEAMHRLNRENIDLQRELIREKHKLEETLALFNAANIELKKLNADKDRFISILAHDLKNPFNGILGFLALLKANFRRYDDNKMEYQLSIIQKSAQQTYSLLEDILSWARAQSSSFPFEPDWLILHNVCSEIADEVGSIAMSKDISIVCSTKDVALVFADANMLKIILRNLVSNAIKFTRAGGNIQIGAKIEGDSVVVSVEDNGIGMEPEVAADLFDLTKKFSTRGTAGEHGTGIGLLLCKDFVEKHQGSIWVNSISEVGTTFSFSIPNKK